ncbi:MAG: EscU/YscU/HrcU family type III secretion system export apparatus switch protein [Anaerolineae bacterium]|nr:EscU/YscU/HrcU family type III secretion system export apparatus switch protein [Anaerolineae bacterium]
MQRSRRFGRANSHRPRAVALSYDADTMPAPTIAAQGQGEVAERIIALAKEHGVTIRQDPDLVTLLAQLDIGQTIPPELYAVVAEVLAFVYQLKTKRSQT